MRVKRYVVDSMPDALEKIRVDLGKDAIILNTKQIRTGGFFGLFGRQQIEVIAATDEKGQSDREKKTPTVATDRSKVAVNAISAKQAYQRNLSNDFGSVATQVEERVATQPIVIPETVTQEPEIKTIPIPVSPASSSQDLPKNEIAEELRDMRHMFQKLLIRSESGQYLPESVENIKKRLISQEIEEKIVARIVENLLKQSEDLHASANEDIYAETKRIIEEILHKGATRSPKIPRTVKHAYFFGPTGVGKTTTIAKLAAEYMLKERRKVGFITSDTYRIAAVDQLKTYANILNVPLEVVFSPKEVEQALDRLSNCDLILIDTAGRNYRNDEFVKGMKEFLRFGETSENYLVLSLSAKYEDMKTIVENFADVPSAKAIFTKADETQSYGAILNIIHHFDYSLSYISTGQNVPDDIVVATPEMVANMIVGEETYGS